MQVTPAAMISVATTSVVRTSCLTVLHVRLYLAEAAAAVIAAAAAVIAAAAADNDKNDDYGDLDVAAAADLRMALQAQGLRGV